MLASAEQLRRERDEALADGRDVRREDLGGAPPDCDPDEESPVVDERRIAGDFRAD